VSDYNLGTAHGKITVDYDDKGHKKALADMEKLKAKAASIMSTMNMVRRRWQGDMNQMAADTTRWSKNLGVATGALYFASAGLIKFSQGINGFRGASGMFQSMALSMGMVPKGAEKFPQVIKDIIRFTAAISVLQGTLGLLGSLGAKFSSLRVGAPIFRSIGAAVSMLRLHVLNLSRWVGMLGNRFGALKVFNPVFFAMQRAIAALGININGLGKHISRLTLGLAPLARAPGIFGAMSAGIGKAVAPFRLISGIALSFAGTIAELNIAKRLIKPLVGIQGGIGGIAQLLKFAHSLGAEIARLGGLIPLAVGAVFALGAAAGIAKIGLMGMGDAIKKGDISKLAPQAGAAVTAIRGLKPEWDKFQKAIQNTMFEGVGPQIDGLKGRLAMMTPVAQTVAASLNGIVKEVIAFAKSTVAINNFSAILSGSSMVLNNLKAAIWPILEALTTIGAVGSQVFAEITSGAGGAAARFRDFINAARDSGQLRAWMMAGVQSIKDLWAALVALKNVWNTTKNALNPGGVTPFFEALKNGAEALDRFLKSAQGQRVLAVMAEMFDRGADSLRKLGDAFLTYVLPAIEAFLPYMRALSEGAMTGLIIGLEVLAPLFKALGEALSFLAPVFEPIMASMVKTVVIIGGLLLLLKIAGVAFFMLKYAVDTVRLAFTIAGFAARLLTGNLRKGELAALKFAGTLIRNLVVAIFAKIKAMILGAAATIRYVAVLVWGAITTAAKWLWARIVIVAQWIWMALQATANAIRIAVVWVVQTIISTALVVARWVWTRIQLILAWLLIKISSILSAIQAFVIWAIQSIIQTARMIIAWTIARIILVLNWLILKIQSMIAAITTFVPWAIQSIIQTGRMILAWVIARIIMGINWMILKIQSLIAALTTFIPWAIQSAIATMQMIIAWTLARIRLMIEWMILKIASMINAIMAFIPWVIQTTIATMQMVIAWTIAKIQVIAAWVMMAIQSMINAVRVAIAWVIANAPAMAAIIMTVIAAIMYVAQWVIMAIGAMVNAVMMAAAWFIALGPIGWVIAIVVALVILIIANWDTIKSFTINTFNTISNWIKTKIEEAKNTVSNVINGIKNFFTNGFNAAKAMVIGAMVAIAVTILTKINQAKAYVSAACIAIPAFFSSLPGRLRDIGNRIIQSFLDGLKAAWGAVTDFIGGIADWITAHKGPPSKDAKLLIPAGVAIMQSLATGLRAGMPEVLKALNDVTDMVTNHPLGAPTARALVNAQGAGASAATNAAIASWNPHERPTGPGVGEQAPSIDYGGFTVTIDAQSVAELQNVTEFFDKVTQTARAGKAPDAA